MNKIYSFKMLTLTVQGKKLFTVQVVCLVIVWTIITPLRVYSRLVTKHRGNRSWRQLPWVEDALMLAAVVSLMD